MEGPGPFESVLRWTVCNGSCGSPSFFWLVFKTMYWKASEMNISFRLCYSIRFTIVYGKPDFRTGFIIGSSFSTIRGKCVAYLAMSMCYRSYHQYKNLVCKGSITGTWGSCSSNRPVVFFIRNQHLGYCSFNMMALWTPFSELHRTAWQLL